MTGAHPSRRRLLRILGAAVALPAAALGLRGLVPAAPPVVWRGEALGALAGLTLWHPDPDVARRALVWVQAEIRRLEAVFSLHLPGSEIVRLNADGALTGPSPDLTRVLDAALHMADLSGGAFDPTIQPLWLARAAAPADPRAWDTARALVDHRALTVGPRAVRLGRPGMAISLDGIAQGWITDRIADLLRNAGFDHAMVQLGETRALGGNPDGTPFAVNLVDPTAPWRTDRVLLLADAALAVSGGYTGAQVIDPATGQGADRLRDVAVVAPRALWADALSTAILVAGEGAAPRLLASVPGARALITRPDGTGGWIG